ncbi:uncharacterized protein B0H18DRAFT_980543 [Fomitopsis serialis]|uniref:uncharacterized protein n=1 Tax=Fomitopsis serialis TaxID=139415 RepID=UPI0020089F56|nr:uncharacterized protein B0H18DRAFT_980543 [Neoantrodia serialis]KAH9934286.1 hypothetical protein B0H18DRAFT_980543 [Neoantrodia serialis]
MTTPAGQPNLGPSIGSLLIAAICSAMLYGSSCAQFAYYLRHYLDRDRLPMRCLVLFVWLLDTIVTISDICIIWFFVVTNHGNLSSLLVTPRVFELEYTTIVVTTCVVQLFYVSQIWQLLRESSSRLKLVITVAPVVLSLVSLAFTVEDVYTIATKTDWLISKSITLSTPWTTSRVWSDAVADVCICIALSWLLRKKKTGIRETDNMIGKLVTSIINRGILSMIVQIVLCGTYVSSIKQNALVWMVPHCAGCKIYVNSMLAVLNARQHVKKGRASVDINMINLTGSNKVSETNCSLDVHPCTARSTSGSTPRTRGCVGEAKTT